MLVPNITWFGSAPFFRRTAIEYMGVHIFNVQSEKADASSEEIKLVKIECEIEGIGLAKKAETGWFTG